MLKGVECIKSLESQAPLYSLPGYKRFYHQSVGLWPVNKTEVKLRIKPKNAIKYDKTDFVLLFGLTMWQE